MMERHTRRVGLYRNEAQQRTQSVQIAGFVTGSWAHALALVVTGQVTGMEIMAHGETAVRTVHQVTATC